jgi:hypothetical protein
MLPSGWPEDFNICSEYSVTLTQVFYVGCELLTALENSHGKVPRRLTVSVTTAEAGRERE